MLIIVIINVNNLDLDSVTQCLYLINNLQESLINLYYIQCIYYLGRSSSLFSCAEPNSCINFDTTATLDLN